LKFYKIADVDNNAQKEMESRILAIWKEMTGRGGEKFDRVNEQARLLRIKVLDLQEAAKRHAAELSVQKTKVADAIKDWDTSQAAKDKVGAQLQAAIMEGLKMERKLNNEIRDKNKKIDDLDLEVLKWKEDHEKTSSEAQSVLAKKDRSIDVLRDHLKLQLKKGKHFQTDMRLKSNENERLKAIIRDKEDMGVAYSQEEVRQKEKIVILEQQNIRLKQKDHGLEQELQTLKDKLHQSTADLTRAVSWLEDILSVILPYVYECYQTWHAEIRHQFPYAERPFDETVLPLLVDRAIVNVWRDFDSSTMATIMSHLNSRDKTEVLTHLARRYRRLVRR